MPQHNAKFVDILPRLAEEVIQGLEKYRPDLLIQIKEASIDRWTHDPSSGADAVYIYFLPRRSLNVAEQNVIGLRHGESLPIEASEGMIVIDTDNFGRLFGIEALFRRDVADGLRRGAAAASSA